MALSPGKLLCATCGREFKYNPGLADILKQFDVATPSECPFCIWKHLLAFWVFGKFRKTTSALSGTSIITTFPESVPFPLYDHEEWISDAWDPMQYGVVYDPARPFFKQFAALRNRVPF